MANNGCYVILNDGETYSHINGCIIYDATTDTKWSVRKDKKIYGDVSWDKGISEIKEVEMDEDDTVVYKGRLVDDDGIPIQHPEPEDDGILGK